MFGPEIYKKIMEQQFRKADGACWDLMTGKIGITTPEGIATISGEGDEASININVMDGLSMPIPAFAQKTAIADIKNGDLIYASSKVLGWVIKKTESGLLRIMRPNGETTSWKPPSVTMIGFDMGGPSGGAMVLRSLMNILPGGATGVADLQSSMLPMLMMAGDKMDMDKLIPMILMQSMSGGSTSGNFMQSIMMMSMLGGGENPMSSMFGSKGTVGHFDRPRR